MPHVDFTNLRHEPLVQSFTSGRDLYSFSVYGKDELYWRGMKSRLIELRQLKQNLRVVIFAEAGDLLSRYVDEYDDQSVLLIRMQLDSTEQLTSLPSPMNWRLLAASFTQARTVSFRDSDSRILKREIEALDDWISAGTDLHIMRDHPHHLEPIMGGMFGIRPRSRLSEQLIAIAQAARDRYGEDQRLLAKFVYPLHSRNSTVHDSIYHLESHACNFPTSRTASEFVGSRELDESSPHSFTPLKGMRAWVKKTRIRLRNLS